MSLNGAVLLLADLLLFYNNIIKSYYTLCWDFVSAKSCCTYIIIIEKKS